MTDSLLAAMKASAGGMRAQGVRVRVTTENVANADTPGYRRKRISFEETGPEEASRVGVKRVYEDSAELARAYDPGNPDADAAGYVTLSNVNTLIEIADLKEAQRSYEAGLSTFEQARSLYQKTIDLLRR